MQIVVPGDPVSQHRPRFSRKSGRAFNSQHEVDNNITWYVAKEWTTAPLEGPIELDLTFYIKIAKSTSKKKRALMLDQPCLKHKDIDNFLKKYLDCMNGIVFPDDSQVWSITAKKIWSDAPRTVITIY
jgi:Holliday junction resolvase RusA-like endonuclease